MDSSPEKYVCYWLQCLLFVIVCFFIFVFVFVLRVLNKIICLGFLNRFLSINYTLKHHPGSFHPLQLHLVECKCSAGKADLLLAHPLPSAL